jgi:hypothetical protein
MDKKLSDMTDQELGDYVGTLYLGAWDFATAGALFRPLLIGAQRVDSLAQVRDAIDRACRVVQALGTACIDTPVDAIPDNVARECRQQMAELLELLARERALATVVAGEEKPHG